MPAAVTSVNDFVACLERSQLLNEELFSKVQSQLSQLEWLGDDPQKLALSLVQSKLLTNFQAQRLLAGFDAGYYLGKYKLLELLGRGGMGKVFLAEQTTMHRLVALKVVGRVIRNQDETFQRFAREAKAVAALHHPNIVQAHDFDQLDGIPYIAMEFVEGIDVEVLIENQKRLEVGQACDFIRQTCAGLHSAHQSGFVHRDIKPGNLLVDIHGVVKILDMGLVSRIEDQRNDSLTTRHDQIGTVDYMAPEQARDSHHVDRRVDLYSLGAVLYFMLSGQILYPGKSTAQKLLAHQSGEPTPLRELNPDVPEEISAIVEKLLKKNPEERYQTAAELGAEIQKFAQPKYPPYEANLLRYSREGMAPFLGRAPELGPLQSPSMVSGIQGSGKVSGSASVVRSRTSDTAPVASADAQTDQSSGTGSGTGSGTRTTDSGKRSGAGLSGVKASPVTKGSPSGVNAKSGVKGASGVRSKAGKSGIKTAPVDDFDDFDDLPLDEFAPAEGAKKLPKLGGKSSEKHDGKKKKKKGHKHDSDSGLMLPLAFGGGLLAILAIGGGLWYAMTPAPTLKKPTVPPTTVAVKPPTPANQHTPATNPAPNPSNPKTDANKPLDNYNDLTKYADASQKDPYKKWVAFSNNLKKDKDIAVYFTMAGKNAQGETLVSDAENPKFGRINGKIDGPTWTVGRFTDKKALLFGGPRTDHRVSLSSADSENFNFEKSFSVACWFKVNEFNPANGSFITLVSKGDTYWRLQRRDKTNTLSFDITESIDKSKNYSQKIAICAGNADVNNKKWHLAVATVDLSVIPAKTTLYIDSLVDSVKTFEKVNKNTGLVSIGSNSEKRLPTTDGGESRTFNGLIDEVLIIQRALKASEIEAYYENSKP